MTIQCQPGISKTTRESGSFFKRDVWRDAQGNIAFQQDILCESSILRIKIIP